MNVLIAPDSYKGSLTAIQVADTMARAVLAEIPDAQIRKIPMADGGEGTVDALVAAGNGRSVPIEVTGPLGLRAASYYGVVGSSAILEAANLCGLTMVPPELRNPLKTTSAALGEAIKAALDAGFAKLTIGLGGSATNDGGMGMLMALGAVFMDETGQPLGGFGNDLAKVARADFSGLDPRLATCQITVACDVKNPLLGPEGATFVYGPQKGATPEMCLELDSAMASYADVIEKFGPVSGHSDGEGRVVPLREIPGAGAAGGLGFALLALGAKLVPGAQVLEEQTNLREAARWADWVLTGEGRSDGQTLYGKLPLHVARVARQEGAEPVLISGSLGTDSDKLMDEFAGCFSIVEQPSDLQFNMDNAESQLYRCTRNVMRIIGRRKQE